jgi:hypothetical protein
MREILVQRNKDFYNEYLNLKSHLPDFASIKKRHIYEMIVKFKAPRFYIDFDTARIYITYRKKGAYPPQIRTEKRRMCDDLYNAYLQLEKEYPLWYSKDIISKVIMMPAPSFYINTQTARQIIINGNLNRL